MTLTQQILTIATLVAATALTRFVPFLLFKGRPTPPAVQYLGKVLPSAVFGMLVIYCLKDVNFTSGAYGMPELAGIIITALLHVWKRQMLISVFGGTACYMVIVNILHL